MGDLHTKSKEKEGNSHSFAERVRVLRALRGLSQPEFAHVIEFSRNVISAVENGKKPSKKFVKALQDLEEISGVTPRDIQLSESADRTKDDVLPTGDDIVALRRIPSVSWAQAGEAVDFEELPTSWQKLVPTDVSDPKAFAITIAGDSMEPRYHANDVATVVPSQTLRQNDLVIARIKDEGVVFKLCSRVGNTYRFSSYNPAYAPFEKPAEKIVWIYPVKQVLKIVI